MKTSAEILSEKLTAALAARISLTYKRAKEEYTKLLEHAEDCITKYCANHIEYRYSVFGLDEGLMKSELERMLIEDGFILSNIHSAFPMMSSHREVSFDIPHVQQPPAR